MSKVYSLNSPAKLARFPVSDKVPLLLSEYQRKSYPESSDLNFHPNFTTSISNYAVTIVGMIDKSPFSWTFHQAKMKENKEASNFMSKLIAHGEFLQEHKKHYYIDGLVEWQNGIERIKTP